MQLLLHDHHPVCSAALPFQDLLNWLPRCERRSRRVCLRQWPVLVRLCQHCPNLPHLHLLRPRYCPSRLRACTLVLLHHHSGYNTMETGQ